MPGRYRVETKNGRTITEKNDLDEAKLMAENESKFRAVDVFVLDQFDRDRIVFQAYYDKPDWLKEDNYDNRLSNDNEPV